MNKKFSSYKKQQMLFENWRKFSNHRPTQLEEDISEILNQLDEEALNEGAMEVMGRIANKMGLNKLLLIAAVTGVMSSSAPAHAGIMDDLNALGNNVRNQITQVAHIATGELETKGVDLEKEIDKSQDTKKDTKKEKKTLEDFVKEQLNMGPVGKVKTVKKVFQAETGNGLGFVYETNEGLVAIAPMDMGVYDMSPETEQSSANMAAQSLLAQYITKDKSTETTTSGDTTTTTTTSKYDGDLPTRRHGQFFTAGDSQFSNWTKGEAYTVISVR